jgi:hypothetical protein
MLKKVGAGLVERSEIPLLRGPCPKTSPIIPLLKKERIRERVLKT